MMLHFSTLLPTLDVFDGTQTQTAPNTSRRGHKGSLNKTSLWTRRLGSPETKWPSRTIKLSSN